MPVEKPAQPKADIPFPEELAHLALVREKVAAALARAEEAVEKSLRDQRDFMQYMVQHHGEIDGKELFQNRNLQSQTEMVSVMALKARDSLSRLAGSPYFARIDFDCPDPDYAGQYYVGRTTFREGNTLYVLDWRAPLASMYYDFELGPAWFDAPAGHIEGTLARKRQFKIAGGEMEYAFESSLAIRDEVLQKELGGASGEKMRSIIATIQREQNLIIRDEAAGVLIIQGVAGSGKTSIALHRVAFLLYRFKDTLSAANVIILSPNMVFADHISGVLPELGEEPVFQMGFWQLARAQLEGIQGFYPEPDPLESDDEGQAARTRYKATGAFLRKLDEFIAQMTETVFVPQDVDFGTFTVDRDWVWERYRAYSRFPVKRRILEIAEDMRDRFISRNIRQEPVPKKQQILSALRAMLAVRTTRALYKQFFRWLGQPRQLVVHGGSLEWNDVYPFLYLHAAFEGLRENHRIRHVVVDEMQDYTPVQFAVLKALYGCRMTILGDFSQALDPNKSHSLADLTAVYPGATVVKLEKSYRSTWEIIAFAGGIRPDITLDAVRRHGPAPEVLACKDGADQLARIAALARAFAAGEGTSLGILAKSQAEARQLHEALAGCLGLPVSLVTPESEAFTAGVSVLSIGMSKGLEFDAVILPDADDAHYHTRHHRNLLYVACTRAMHALTLLHTGKKSRLLP